MSTPSIGSIGWIDLTVPDATATRDFYSAVVGWTSTPIDMDGYSDYCMAPPDAEAPVAGICHARGDNLGLPAQWLMYITVASLADSLAACTQAGGTIVRETRPAGPGLIAVIKDPAGAVCALYQP